MWLTPKRWTTEQPSVLWSSVSLIAATENPPFVQMSDQPQAVAVLGAVVTHPALPAWGREQPSVLVEPRTVEVGILTGFREWHRQETVRKLTQIKSWRVGDIVWRLSEDGYRRRSWRRTSMRCSPPGQARISRSVVSRV